MRIRFWWRSVCRIHHRDGRHLVCPVASAGQEPPERRIASDGSWCGGGEALTETEAVEGQGSGAGGADRRPRGPDGLDERTPAPPDHHGVPAASLAPDAPGRCSRRITRSRAPGPGAPRVTCNRCARSSGTFAASSWRLRRPSSFSTVARRRHRSSCGVYGCAASRAAGTGGVRGPASGRRARCAAPAQPRGRARPCARGSAPHDRIRPLLGRVVQTILGALTGALHGRR